MLALFPQRHAMPAQPSSTPRVAVIGGGPAGLMAAEVLSQGGAQVELYDAMPSVGRKFLLAGKGGMNITHAEPYPDFVQRYGARQREVGRWLEQFDASAVRGWIHDLGVDTFVGSSGRVFPTDMKAAPLLRAWLHRLRDCNCTCGIGGWAGNSKRCAFPRRTASCRCRPTRWCWLWAAATGQGWARTAPGCRCSNNVLFRCPP